MEQASSAQLRILAHLYRSCKSFVSFSRDDHRTSLGSGRGSGSEGRFDGVSGPFDVSMVPVHVILLNYLACVRVSPSFPSLSAAAHSFPYPSSPSLHAWGAPSGGAELPQPPLSYFGVDPTVGAVPIIAERVSLPSGLSRVPFLSLLPPSLAAAYQAPTSVLLLEPQTAERAAISSAPRFFGSEKEYLKLLRRMLHLNMIAFTTCPIAVNGVFGVPKDGTEIRLIIDATPANSLFVPCPHVSLPDPSHLGRLYVPPGGQLWMAKSDLESFYHQLALPQWLQPYFALPGLKVDRLVAAGLIQHGQFPVGTALVYPMCTTLPMGWSHSVFVGQSVHEHVAYALGQLNPSDNIVHLESPIIDRPLHGLIVDDIGVLSNSQAGCTSTMDQLMAAYSRAGLQVKMKKLRPPSRSPMQFLGMLINGVDLTIRLPVDKLRRLVCLTIDLLRSEVVSGVQLERVVGLWTWQLMLARPALSIFHSAYRYMHVAGEREGQLWSSVRSELVTMLSILPLLRISMSDDWYPRLVATDASELGAGVVSTALSHALFQLLWPLTASRHALAAHMTAINQLNQQSDRFGVDTSSEQLRLVQPSIERRGGDPISVERRRIASARSCLEQLSASGQHWQTLISTPWRWEQHINALELQSIILAMRRILSSPAGMGRRVMLLCDSAVVAFTLVKGRSSAASLVRGTKKIAALLLAAGCRIEISWVPTHLNPADGPSRLITTTTTTITSVKPP